MDTPDSAQFHQPPEQPLPTPPEGAAFYPVYDDAGTDVARDAFHAAEYEDMIHDKMAMRAAHDQIQSQLDVTREKYRTVVEENKGLSHAHFKTTEANAKLKEEAAELKPLAERAMVDDLTGVKSRYATRLAYNELVSARKKDRDASREHDTVAFVDLDDMKKINDTFGHARLDRVLRYVGYRLNQIVRREGDVVGRIGGDEFFIIVRNTGREDALEVLEDIRRMVQHEAGGIENELSGEVEKTGLTASIGVARLNPEKTFDEAIDAADKAMYEAKKQGRNRIIALDEQTPTAEA